METFELTNCANQVYKKEKKRERVNFAKLLFILVEIALVLAIAFSLSAIIVDYCSMALTSFGPLFFSTQSRIICIVCIIANRIVLSLHINSNNKSKHLNASVILLFLVILFSFSSYSLLVQSKYEISTKQAAIELPYINSNDPTLSFNQSYDIHNNLTCCGKNYTEFYRNGSTHFLLPNDFEVLPDSCCSEAISIENVTYPGAVCHITMNVCFARKYVEAKTLLNYLFQAIYCYYISLLWSLAFISVLTFDQSTINLDISA